MKHLLIGISFLFIFITGFSQTDSLLNSLQTTTAKQDLFPKKMLFTQRLAWGEKGFLRFGKTVTPEMRMEDMKIRRKMLVTHQILGVVTMAGFVGQAIVGPKLYNDPTNRSLKQTHEALALLVNTTYSMTALMSLFAPPPMVNRDKGFSAIRLHKWLAVVHMTGMIATNILAAQMDGNRNQQLMKYHRAAAYTTFASYLAAMIVIKLK